MFPIGEVLSQPVCIIQEIRKCGFYLNKRSGRYHRVRLVPPGQNGRPCQTRIVPVSFNYPSACRPDGLCDTLRPAATRPTIFIRHATAHTASAVVRASVSATTAFAAPRHATAPAGVTSGTAAASTGPGGGARHRPRRGPAARAYAVRALSQSQAGQQTGGAVREMAPMRIERTRHSNKDAKRHNRVRRQVSTLGEVKNVRQAKG